MKKNQQIAPLAVPDSKSIRAGFKPLMTDQMTSPIVVKIAHYKGKRRLSIRFHYWKGELLGPTKRGIEVPIEHAHEVRDLINIVLAQLKPSQKIQD